jgi:hypothetical protein
MLSFKKKAKKTPVNTTTKAMDNEFSQRRLYSKSFHCHRMLNSGVVLNKIKHESLQILRSTFSFRINCNVLFCLFDCLSPQEQFVGYLAAVANTGDRAYA